MPLTSLNRKENENISLLADVISEDGVGFLWTGGIESQVIAHMLLERVDDSVPFLTVDTENQLDSVYEFRSYFHDKYDFEWNVRRNSDILSKINNPSNNLGYHGEGDWTVEESCGALKTVPIQDFIEEDGYETLITGTRSDDTVADDGLSAREERHSPSPHTRVHPLADWSEAEVWAYVRFWFLEYPDVYDEGIYHTDSECCMDDNAVGERGEGALSPDERERRNNLKDMGYV